MTNVMMNETMNTEVIVLNTPSEVLNFKSEILEKQFVEIPVLDYKAKAVYTLPVFGSKLTKYSTFMEMVLPDLKGNLVNFDSKYKYPLLADWLKMAFGVKGRVIKAINKYGVWVEFNGKNSNAYYFLEGNHGEVKGAKSWTTGEAIFGKEYDALMAKLNNLAAIGKAKYYKAFDFSPSDVRTYGQMLRNVTVNDDREILANELTSGGYDLLKGTDKDRVELTKIGGRIGMNNAPSTNFGEIPGILFVNKKLKNYVSNSDTWDGNATGRSSYLADVFGKAIAKHLGKDVQVAPKAVVGLMTQDRPANAKEATVWEADDTFDRLKNRLMKKYSYEIIGDENNIVMILDANCMKLDGDFNTYRPNMYILDIAKSSAARLSKQFVSKMLDQDCSSVLVEMYKDMLKTEFSNILTGKNPLPTPEEIAGAGYGVDTVVKIRHQELMEDPSLFIGKFRNTVQRGLRSVDRLGIPAEGANLRLCFEKTQLYIDNPMKALLGHPGIMKRNEGFAKKLWALVKDRYEAATTEEEKEKALVVAMIKYPSMGTREIFIFRVVPPTELRERIKAMNCSKTEKHDVSNHFFGMSEGVLILPCYDDIKKQCAGLDTDFDGATVISDPKVVQYVCNIPVEIVDVEAPKHVKPQDGEQDEWGSLLDIVTKDDDQLFKLSIDTINSVGYVGQVMNKNLTVGVITNFNDILIAAGYDKVWAIKMILAIAGSIGSGEYVSPLEHHEETNTYVVRLENAYGIMEAIRKMDPTEENMRKAYDDMNRLYRAYQELTIDSAKTGYEVPVDIEPKNVVCASLLELSDNAEEFIESLKQAKNGHGKAIAYKVERQTAREGIEVINDKMAMIQDLMVAQLETAVNKVVGEGFMRTGLSQKEVDALNSLMDGNPVSKDLMIFRSMYTACAIAYGNARRSEEMEDFEDRVETDENTTVDEKVAKEQFDKEMEIQDNTVRQLLKGMDPARAGAMIKAISLTTSGGADIDGKRVNQMPYSICFDYTLSRIASKPDAVKVCGYKLLSGHKYVEVGTELNFVAGTATTEEGKTVILKDSTYTGALSIYEHDDSLYAVKPIKVEIKEADESRIAFQVRKAFNVQKVYAGEAVMETYGKKSVTFPKWGYDRFEESLAKAKKIQLVPRYETKAKVNGKDTKVVVRDCILATYELKGELVTLPVGRYCCESPVLEKLYNGVYGTLGRSMLKINDYQNLFIELNIDGRQAVETTNFKATVVDTVAVEVEEDDAI